MMPITPDPPRNARRPDVPLALVAAVLALSACEAGDPDAGGAPSGVTRADSASIHLLTDARDPGELPVIDLATAEPDLVVGEVSGDEPYLFSRIRGAVPLPGGGLAVADGATARIRIFDAEGRFIRAFGGLGDGPSEFRQLGSLGLVGPDTLFAWDPSRMRLSFFSPEGTVHASVDARDVGGGWPPEADPLSTRTALLTQHVVDRVGGSDAGILPRADSIVLHLATDGVLADTIGRFPGLDRALVRSEMAPGMVLATNVPIPFGNVTVGRVAGARIVLARSDRGELRILDEAGRLEEIRRYPNLGGRRTPAAIEAAAAEFEVHFSGAQSRRHFDELIEATSATDRVPPFTDLRASESGGVWLRAVPTETDAPPAWWVVAPDGLLAVRVELPAGFQLLHAGDQVVLGVVRDEMGVERVVRYGLR